VIVVLILPHSDAVLIGCIAFDAMEYLWKRIVAFFILNQWMDYHVDMRWHDHHCFEIVLLAGMMMNGGKDKTALRFI
jgi:hypothetical protein